MSIASRIRAAHAADPTLTVSQLADEFCCEPKYVRATLGRKEKITGQITTKIHVHLTEDHDAEVRAEAVRSGKTVSQIVREAVAAWVESRAKDERAA